MNITDDSTFEGAVPETFEVQLTVQARASDDDLQSVTADPAVLTISIVDDDSEVFVGFEQTSLRANESDGTVELCLGFDLPPGEQTGAEFGVSILLDEDDSTAGKDTSHLDSKVFSNASITWTPTTGLGLDTCLVPCREVALLSETIAL